MKLNSLMQIFRNIMARKKIKAGNFAMLDQLRVQLNPVEDKTHRSATRRKAVQQLIGMMISDLHRRGRPRKDADGGISNAA
ncbi:MAG: hypothetical protein AABY64_04715 [Bdellovibrionota bacterium]